MTTKGEGIGCARSRRDRFAALEAAKAEAQAIAAERAEQLARLHGEPVDAPKAPRKK